MKSKRLVVSKSGLELAEIFPDRPLLLIGRSPACDMVLRLPGIRPVHFLLEWVGEGVFDPTAQLWTLTEVGTSTTALELSSAGSGRGVVLEPKSTDWAGLTWSWKSGGLSRRELEKGRTAKQLQALEGRDVDFVGGAGTQFCLEVMKLSVEGDAVVDVEYLRRKGLNRSKILREEPKLRVKWSGHSPRVEWEGISEADQALKRKMAFDLEPARLLVVRGLKRPYYLRLVPRMMVREAPYEVFKDPFVRSAAFGFTFAFLGLFLLTLTQAPPEEIVNFQSRVATVEIKEVPPPPPPAVEVIPPPPVSPPPPPDSVEEVQKAPQSKPQVLAPIPPKPQPVAHKPKVAPMAQVPVQNVNSVGLLGSMKKSSAPKSSLISVEQMVSAKPDESVVGDSGQVLARLPAPVIASTKAERPNSGGQNYKTALMEASAQVPIDDLELKGSAAIIHKSDGAAFSILSGDDADGKGEGAGAATGFGESVVGGLDKVSVGRAVAAQRSKIRACYQNALFAKPKLSGRLVVNWKISPRGKVSTIRIKTSSLKHPSLEACVLAVLQAIEFPSDPGGKSTSVIYPFVFKESQ